MFQTVSVLSAAARPFIDYCGPERRTGPTPAARVLSMMLDEIDYGMLLLSDEGVLSHLNRAARADLDDEHPLRYEGGRLCARHARDNQRLREALESAAKRGLRKLISVGEGSARVNVAVIPIGAGASLVVLGKRRLSERISVDCFARLHKLTPAESRVLEGLCEGLEPKEVAELNVVGVATVRTQIGSIRAKTGADSIRALVRQVAVLPPIVGALRC